MWDSFWDYLWSAVVIFAFIAYLMILFNILADLFWRDHKTSGWIKAVWVLFLIVFPYVTALIYLIARGKGMAERAQQQAQHAKTDRRLHQAGGRSLTGAGDRRREGAPGRRHDHPGRLRRAESEGLTER